MERNGLKEKPMRESAPAGSVCVDEKEKSEGDGPNKPLGKGKKPYQAADFNRNSIFLNIVSFLIPFVGIGLYAIFKEKEPVKTKGILTGTLLGFGLFLLFLFWLKYQSDTMA